MLIWCYIKMLLLGQQDSSLQSPPLPYSPLVTTVATDQVLLSAEYLIRCKLMMATFLANHLDIVFTDSTFNLKLKLIFTEAVSYKKYSQHSIILVFAKNRSLVKFNDCICIYLYSDHKNVASSSYLTRHLSATWRLFSCLWNVITALIPTKAWQTGVRIWAVCNSHNIWLSATGGGWHMVSVNWLSRLSKLGQA